MKVAYTLPDETACTWYRVQQPIVKAAANNAFQARALPKGENPDKLAETIAHADVVVDARKCDERLIENIKSVQETGKKVVMDYDDDLFSVSPISHHYKDFGTENYSYELNGKVIPVWVDGQNLNIEENRKRLDLVKRTCEAVDMVTVTTDRLADAFRQYSGNVKVLPNCVDLDIWKKLPLRRERDEIRMGWSGGASHCEDLWEVAPVLPVLAKKYPNLKIVIVGHKFASSFKDIPEDQIEFHKWVPNQAHPYKQATLDLDFAFIPLKDSKFNHGKSPLKWLEAAALKVPAVTSYVAPYDTVAESIADNGIFVENDFEAWLDGLTKMIEHPELRLRMGEAAYQTVLRDFDMNTQWQQWANAYQEVLSWQPRVSQPLAR